MGFTAHAHYLGQVDADRRPETQAEQIASSRGLRRHPGPRPQAERADQGDGLCSSMLRASAVFGMMTVTSCKATASESFPRLRFAQRTVRGQ